MEPSLTSMWRSIRHPSLTNTTKAIETFIAGYRGEHFILALQMFICIIVAMFPVLLDRLYIRLDEDATFWVVVVAAVVMEPSTGNAIRKFAFRMLAVGMALAMGVCILQIAFKISGTPPHEVPQRGEYLGHMVSLGLAICAALVTLHRHRWDEEFGYAFFLCLLTLCIITVPGLRQAPADALSDAGYRGLNVVIGVTVSALVTALILPIRAGDLLRNRCSAGLLRTGDLAAWVLSQPVITEPRAGNVQSTSATGTDTHMRYVDDGLAEELEPLFSTSRGLGRDLAVMDGLLRSARAEVRFFARPHRFPYQRYRALLGCLHTALGLLQTQLYHMRAGDFAGAADDAQAGEIADAGVQLSLAFAALARRSNPPRMLERASKHAASRAKKIVRWVAGCGRGHDKASSGAGSEVADGGDGVRHSHDAKGLSRDAEGMRDLEPATAAAADAAERQGSTVSGGDDDPFASLDDGATPDHIRLSSAELANAQLRVRQLSYRQHIDAAVSRGLAGPMAPAIPEEEPDGEELGIGVGVPTGSVPVQLPVTEPLGRPGDQLLSAGATAMRLLTAARQPCDVRAAASLTQTAGCILGLARQGAAILATLDPEQAQHLHARMSRLPWTTQR